MFEIKITMVHDFMRKRIKGKLKHHPIISGMMVDTPGGSDADSGQSISTTSYENKISMQSTVPCTISFVFLSQWQLFLTQNFLFLISTLLACLVKKINKDEALF